MFWIYVITLSLVSGFTSYSHTPLLRSRPFHHHVASWPWSSDDRTYSTRIKNLTQPKSSINWSFQGYFVW